MPHKILLYGAPGSGKDTQAAALSHCGDERHNESYSCIVMTDAENIRPWGRYDIIETGAGYQVKRIVVQPRQRLSYQRHAQRAERWVIVSGTAKVTLDDVESLVVAGEVIHVATMMKHRIENPGDVLLLFIEVQLGDYLGEDDIERFSDDYGRG